MHYKFKQIETVDDIKEQDISDTKYFTYNSNKWFSIDKDADGYCIFGMLCGDVAPTSVCVGDYVKYWKTFKGVKRAIKLFSKNSSWSFQGIFSRGKR